jgi:hypothetical protein
MIYLLISMHLTAETPSINTFASLERLQEKYKYFTNHS